MIYTPYLLRDELLDARGFLAKPLRILGCAIKQGSRLERFEAARARRRCGFCEKLLEFSPAQRVKCLDRFKGLLNDWHAVDSGDVDRSRQTQRIMQAFDRRHCIGLEENAVGHALHSKNAHLALREF